MGTRRIRLLAALAAAVTLGGCHNVTDPIVEQHTDLARAEAQWLAAGIHDYTYEIGSYSAWFVDSLRVDVRNDAVTSATVLGGSADVHGFGMTVPDMFAAIHRGLAEGSDVRASFHGTLGYPIRIDIPDPPGVADASWSANVGNFQPR